MHTIPLSRMILTWGLCYYSLYVSIKDFNYSQNKVTLRSLRKQPTFGDATTGFPAKWHLRNERRNSILMTRHYPDLGSVSYWLSQISHAVWESRSTTQIWVVTHHQYGISALLCQTSFGWETSGSVAKCRLFSQAIHFVERKNLISGPSSYLLF